MAIFKKRETLTQNIAYMGIMAAINVIFVLLTTYVLPVLFFILIFILPLTSTVVCLFCNKKYFPIYVIATVGICILTTLGDFSNTLFYVIPSIVSGFAFGFLIERNVSSIWCILFGSIITLGFNYLAVPIIQALYQRNIITTFASIFNLVNYKYLDYVAPCFFLFLSFAQTSISYFVIKSELPKLGVEYDDKETNLFVYIGGLVSLLLTILFTFVFPQLAYFFGMFIVYFAIIVFVEFCEDINVFGLVFSGVSLLVTFAIFGIFYNRIPQPLGVMLVFILFILILVAGLISKYLLKNHKELK